MKFISDSVIWLFKYKKILLLISATIVTVVSLTMLFYNVAFQFQREYCNDTVSFVRAFEIPFNPWSIQYYNNKLFVFNGSDRNIVVYDTMGNIIRKYGRRGRGPDEFLNVVSMEVDSTGIKTIDTENLRILERNFNDSITLVYHVTQSILRGTYVGNHNYVISAIRYDNEPFQIFECINIVTHKTKQIKLFDIYNIKEFRDVQLDGFLFKNKNNSCFGVGHWTGRLFSFDENGTITFNKKTIDGSRPPEIIKTSNGYGRGKNTPPIHKSAIASSKYVFVNSRLKTVKDYIDNNTGTIDIYNAANGEYQWSFKIPAYNNSLPTLLCLDDKNGMYVLQGLYLVYYKLNFSVN